MPDRLLGVTVPANVTITLVAAAFFDGCTVVRAPALDKRNALRVVNLYVKQLGVTKVFSRLVAEGGQTFA